MASVILVLKYWSVSCVQWGWVGISKHKFVSGFDSKSNLHTAPLSTLRFSGVTSLQSRQVQRKLWIEVTVEGRHIGMSQGLESGAIFFFFFLFFFFNVYLFWETEREGESGEGAERERGKERISGRLCALSVQISTQGLISQMMRSWPELISRVGHLTNWATRSPSCHFFPFFFFVFFVSLFLRETER